LFQPGVQKSGENLEVIGGYASSGKAVFGPGFGVNFVVDWSGRRRSTSDGEHRNSEKNQCTPQGFCIAHVEPFRSTH
jgi:hypothetical protein